MARTGKDLSITQKNDASCVGNQRGMAKRAKTNSNKRDRRLLREDLEKKIDDLNSARNEQ